MGNHDDGIAVLLLHLLHKLDNLCLNGHVESRGGLVGNQDVGVAGKCHSNHNALAHTARELMRVLVHALLGLGDAHQVKQLGSTLECLFLAVTTVQTKALAHLLTDLVDRVERRHGVLEDHGDVVTANVLHFLFTHIEQRLAAILHGAAVNLSGRHRDEAHDGHGRHGLTRTRLAYHAEGLAAVERIGNAVNRMDDTVLGMEVHLKVIDFEKMLALRNGLRLEIDVVFRILLHDFMHPSS